MSADNAKTETTSRRKFARQLGMAAGAAAAALAGPSVASASRTDRPPTPNGANGRVMAALELRMSEATRDALLGPAVNVNNGDTARYADKGGTYTKALPHDAYGRVDLNAFATFTAALESGKSADFEKILMGGTRTLTGSRRPVLRSGNDG